MDDYDDCADQLMDYFEKDVLWLQNHVPPDDIYQFCQQILMGASFLIDKWKKGKDFNRLSNSDPLIRVWLQNIHGILSLQKSETNCRLKTDQMKWGFDANVQD